MTTPQPQILLAARRWTKLDGTLQITLVNIKTGVKYDVEEAVLRNEKGCALGDFICWIGDKLEKKPYLDTIVSGDIVYVDNIRAKLVNMEGFSIFQSVLFGNALCKQQLQIGDYDVRMNLLFKEHKLPSGTSICFEVTNPRPVRDNLQYPPVFPPRPTFQPIHPAGPISFGSPQIQESPILSGNSNVGSRASTPARGEPVVKGSGFPNKSKPKNNPKGNNNKVFGPGFGVKKEENQEKKVIVGNGFTIPEKKDKVVVGGGFEVVAPKRLKLRAVVLSILENTKNGTNTHFLWILEKQAEGRFVSKDYKLLQGHFFEGFFIENVAGKWNCEKYEKQVDKPAGLDGGLDFDGKIWFSVSVNKFQPVGGNRRFGKATAKYFGEVVDGELESTKLSDACNGKNVKIQRKGIAEHDYVWMVVEIL